MSHHPSLDLNLYINFFIIAFLKAFDIKRLLLKRIIFFFIGACLLRSAMKMF